MDSEECKQKEHIQGIPADEAWIKAERKRERERQDTSSAEGRSREEDQSSKEDRSRRRIRAGAGSEQKEDQRCSPDTSKDVLFCFFLRSPSSCRKQHHAGHQSLGKQALFGRAVCRCISALTQTENQPNTMKVRLYRMLTFGT